VSIVQTYETLGISSYYTGNVVQGRLALLRSVQWAERAGLTAELSRAYSTFAIVPAVFHRSRIARQYMAIARGAADALQDAHAQFVALGRGQLPHFIVGEWDVAIPALEQAVVLGATVGDPHGHQIHMYQLALVRLNRGDTERALDDFRRLLHDARESRTAVNQLWALAGLSETTFRLGRLEEAIAYAAETVSLAASVETTDQNGRFQAYGVLARSWLRQEGIERARPFLEAAMAAGRAGGRSSYAPQMGFLGVTDVLLAIRQRGGADSQQADAALKDWLSIMRVEGFFKPIVKPWHLIVRARWHRLRGRHRRAVSDLRQAISLSERLHLPYEAAVARTDLGQALPVGDPERDRHLQEARQAFERIGARGEPMYTSEHISM
jgi:tetratricopeptide (TPR) repeat protein